jgi:hypothetical protein
MPPEIPLPAAPTTTAPPTMRATTTDTATSTVDGVTLSWKFVRGAQSLDVWFKVDNQSDKRIYICDKLLSYQKNNTWKTSPGASVQNDRTTRTQLKIVVGTPATDSPSVTIPPVTYLAVEPNTTHERTIALNWPLKSYNVMGMTSALNKEATQAVFQVQSFAGEPGFWNELPADGGGTVKVPAEFTPQPLVGPPLPLPQ